MRLMPIENGDAYYTIDLVVSNADARVVFIGDGPSNLPDPSFIARANETNTVELLIGKTYEIKCDLPFRVVDASDWRVDSWQRSSKSATVVWPVEIYMDYGYSLRSGLLQAPRLGSPSGGRQARTHRSLRRNSRFADQVRHGIILYSRKREKGDT